MDMSTQPNCYPYYIMFNVISHRAEILLSLIFAERADINQMSKGFKAISFLGFLTRQYCSKQENTIILAAHDNADLRTCSILIIQQFCLLTSCISRSFFVFYHVLNATISRSFLVFHQILNTTANLFLHERLNIPEVYSEPSRILRMELFTKIFNGKKPLTILVKSSILLCLYILLPRNVLYTFSTFSEETFANKIL